MAEHAAPKTQPAQATDSDEAFVADRQQFWSSFTSVALYATIGIAALLIGMAVFLL